MKVAVTSQDGLTVTGHAGRCQRFWLFELEGSEVRTRSLVEVTQAQTFHASHHALPEPLQGITALLSGGMGSGLVARLKEQGIAGVITSETNPERAVAGWVAGTLELLPPHEHGSSVH